MNVIHFRMQGRFGHFLRAEANASAPTYPVPPRTALLGLIGAVLGLPKDTPQTELEPASIALAGGIPPTYWHKIKLRKDPPETLPKVVKRTQKADKHTKPEKATLIAQEWLLNPRYEVWVALPPPYHTDFNTRLQERRWHFQPCLGLTELMADLVWEESLEAEPLPHGIHRIESVFPRESGALDMDAVFEERLVLHALRMPRQVTPDRVFTHASYFLEKTGRPVPVSTSQAYRAGEAVIAFL
ncbi:MAG: CRISPR-associated protein Cas5 [Nitrospirae bacterium]|nr:MAG: CRISPR-associated protein Cas5 [Nitrospirota bacterium]